MRIIYLSENKRIDDCLQRLYYISESYYALAEDSKEVNKDQINYSPYQKTKSPLPPKNTQSCRQLDHQKTALTDEERVEDRVSVRNDISSENSNNSSSDSSSSKDLKSDDNVESSKDTNNDKALKTAVLPPSTNNIQKSKQQLLFTHKQVQQMIKSTIEATVNLISKNFALRKNQSKTSMKLESSNLFTFPPWSRKEKSRKHKQWKMWSKQVKLELKGLGLYKCITIDSGNPSWDEDTRITKNARAQTYLNAAVLFHIESSMVDSPSPYQLYKQLEEGYGNNDTKDVIDLWKKMNLVGCYWELTALP